MYILTTDETIEIITDISNQELTESELEFISVFKEVALASLEYWTIYLENNNSKINPDAVIIINDAVGASIGLTFGGFGSIVLGAVVSLGTMDELGMLYD